MLHEWIKAPLALEYVSVWLPGYTAQLRICERAHAGLIAAKAERIIWAGQEEQEQLIGKGFWWAEGHEALEQDWKAGDFATWIDKRVEVKAFGVSFDFNAISELVPADKQAEALRRISVVAHDDWIGARELHLEVLEAYGPTFGSEKLLEACRLGQLGARAMRATYEHRQGNNLLSHWQAREWDVPQWFWRNFAKRGNKTKFEWAIGRVVSQGQIEGRDQRIELQGLHFHRSGLVNMGLGTAPDGGDASADSKRRGRRPLYDWPAASAAIWGQIYRGDLIPQNQAEIERAFQRHLAKGDKEPSESTVRPFAKLIWDQVLKA